MSTGKVGDGHHYGVRPVVHHPSRYPIVEESRHHRLGDASDLPFGRENRLGDGPEDFCAVVGFPIVEFVPDVFVDGPSEFFKLGDGSGGGILEGKYRA